MLGLVVWFWHWLFHDVVRASLLTRSSEWLRCEQMLADHATGIAVFATCMTSVFLGMYIVRATWRKVNSVSSKQSLKPYVILAAGFIGILALLSYAWLPSWNSEPTAIVDVRFPKITHISRNRQAVQLVHDNSNVHYVFTTRAISVLHRQAPKMCAQTPGWMRVHLH
jgi:hypothetical protein